MADKIGYLDSLRGIAALVVVLNHFGYAFYPAIVGDLGEYWSMGYEWLIYTTPLSLLFYGRFAVFIFFVLSGYVLTYKFFASGDRSVLTSGAIRRYFRLLPLIVVSLLCTYAILLAFGGVIYQLAETTGNGHLYTYFNQPPDLLSILRQAFWGSFFDPHVSYNDVLWTMGYEFLGSMLVFSLASLFGKARNRWVFYLGAGLFLLNTYYLAFLLGMLLADMYNGSHRKLFAIESGPLILLVLAAGLFMGSYKYDIAYRQILDVPALGLGLNPDTLFHSLGAFLVLLALLNSRKLKELLSLKPLTFLGTISFSTYLLHQIVFGTFTAMLLLVLLNGLHLAYPVSLVIAFPLTMVVLFAVSYLAYRYVDLNGIKLSKRIYENYFLNEPRPGQKPVSYEVLEK